MNKRDAQIFNIKQIFPCSIVYEPEYKGRVRDVYIVKPLVSEKKFVCRFSDKNTALHNFYVSGLLNSNNICVPKVSLRDFGKEYCEVYPFINGKTLYERQQEGMAQDKMYDVYKQLFNITHKISKIPYKTAEKPYVPVAVKFATYFFGALNSADFVLCHTDLNPKNVLLNKDDKVSALLDLDAVYPESLAFTFLNMIKYAQDDGRDIGPLVKLCRQNGIQPRIMEIEKQLEFYGILRNVYRCFSK